MRGTADLPRGADRAARARRLLEQGNRARSRARATDDQDPPDAHVPQARRVESHGAGRRAVPVIVLQAGPRDRAVPCALVVSITIQEKGREHGRRDHCRFDFGHRVERRAADLHRQDGQKRNLRLAVLPDPACARRVLAGLPGVRLPRVDGARFQKLTIQ
ncbi:hypothetical protein F01_460404 [Burkholderia cenocepacia]|nr:hypothetical protein F01_460404 [Burkholderia cenocepacia]